MFQMPSIGRISAKARAASRRQEAVFGRSAHRPLGPLAVEEGHRRRAAVIVENRDRDCQRGEQSLTPDCGEIRRGEERQHSSAAQAEQVARVGSADGGDGIEHLHDADHVLVEPDVSVAGVRIDPGRDEDLAPGVEFRAGNRLLRFEVEQVVLVDRRRDDEERDRVDLIGARLVLDELVDPGLAHDLSRGGGEVAPEFEGRLVDAGGQLGRRAQVGEQIPPPARRLWPPVSITSFQLSGFVSRPFVGESAAVTLAKVSRSRSRVRQSTSASSRIPDAASQVARYPRASRCRTGLPAHARSAKRRSRAPG